MCVCCGVPDHVSDDQAEEQDNTGLSLPLAAAQQLLGQQPLLLQLQADPPLVLLQFISLLLQLLRET